MTRRAIFDCGGTLVDSGATITAALKDAGVAVAAQPAGVLDLIREHVDG